MLLVAQHSFHGSHGPCFKVKASACATKVACWLTCKHKGARYKGARSGMKAAKTYYQAEQITMVKAPNLLLGSFCETRVVATPLHHNQ